MKTKRLIAVVVICGLTVAGVFYAHSFAFGEEEKAVPQYAEKFDKLSEELGLSSLQKEQLKKQRADFAAKRKEIGEKIREKSKALRAELEKPKIDKAKAYKLTDDIKALSGERLRNRVDSLISMRQILTEEQFKKLQEKAKEKRTRMMEHRPRHFKR